MKGISEKNKVLTAPSINWGEIECVLLDMDGTLLDRHFDDYFWEDYLPEKYARRYGLSVDEAKEELIKRYEKEEGTLNWTDLDFWSNELGLDILLLKKEVEHLIQVHPYVIPFLEFLKGEAKRVYLVTNAHSKTLELKMQKTEIGLYFDRVISAFDVGFPKEKVEFWKGLEAILGFEKEKTLLADDSEDSLAAASEYGIRYLIYVARPSTKKSPRPSKRFPSITYFKEIIPYQPHA